MKKRLALLQPVRLSMMLAGVLCLGAVLGQTNPDLPYRIHFTTAIAPFQEKFVHEGLRSQDPQIAIVVEHQAHQVLVSTIAHLDRNELQAAISPSGLTIDEMGPIDHEVSGERAMGDTSSSTYPDFVDTGDPVQDNMRYEMLKRAWIAQHPEGYEQLNNSTPDR